MHRSCLIPALLLIPFLCHAQIASVKPTELRREQSLRNAKISKSKREALVKAITKQLQAEIDEPISEEAMKSVLDTSVEFIDLDADHRPEVIAQAMTSEVCSPTGNCSFWIFREDGTEYKPILEGEAHLFRIYKTRTNSYRDIALGRHASAFIGDWHLYRFSDRRYIDQKCWAEIYGGPESDKPYPKPKIEPCD
jgi:hypothetical protein